MSTKKRMARSECICEKILCNHWKTTLFKKTESQGIMLRKKGYKSIQLTLAQCRFELHRVHLHLGIFSIARTTALHNMPQAESQDAEELWIRKVNYKLHTDEPSHRSQVMCMNSLKPNFEKKKKKNFFFFLCLKC